MLAQPGIGQNGVVNRASQIPTTLAGGSIAHGAVFTIRGVRFGSAAVVSLKKGTVVSPVRVVAVQPDRIEAIMPDTAPVGPVALVVTAGGSASKPFSMEVAASNPGVFSQNKLGWGPGQVENVDAAGKRTLNSTTNPATPGQRVAMRITGLGKETPAIVMIGNREANAGLAKATAQSGEQEISFGIPADAPSGCYVPVYLQALPTRASNVVTMTVQPATNRGKCDSGPIPMLDAKRVAMVVAARTNMYKIGGNTNTAEVIATFAVREPGRSLSPLLLLPPPGTCTVYTGSLQTTANSPITVSGSLNGEIGTDGLAAGPQLTLGRDTRRRIIPWDRNAIGYYHARVPPWLLNPGKFFLSGPGGMDVGAFRITADAAAPFEWTDRDQTDVVTRSHGLQMHWRGQMAGRRTMLLATNVNQLSTAIGTCLCVVPLNANHFEIPAAMLANIPTSYDAPGTPYDHVFVVSMPAKGIPLSAPGIGAGVLLTIYSSGRSVQFH